jgi:hypothetical protein
MRYRETRMIVSAYYLNGSCFSVVPRHVRQDFQWMADHGTDAVCLSMYEGDLASRRKWDVYFGEAERAGLAVYAVPSRWAGLIAGWPGAPSRFTATHPETWMLQEDGRPIFSATWGAMSSVHHPATMEFFRHCLDMLLAYPVAGIVWDEVKTVMRGDFSPMAREKMPAEAGMEWHIDATAEFFDAAGRYARQKSADLVICMFLYSFLAGYVVERCAAIASIDQFGCDGRACTAEQYRRVFGAVENPKVLLADAPRFIDAAGRHGKGAFVLVETQGMPAEGNDPLERNLPEILSWDLAHLAYYYYPTGTGDVERTMAVQGKHLKAIRH